MYEQQKLKQFILLLLHNKQLAYALVIITN